MLLKKLVFAVGLGELVRKIGFSSGCLLSGRTLCFQGVWWGAFSSSTHFQLVVPL